MGSSSTGGGSDSANGGNVVVPFSTSSGGGGPSSSFRYLFLAPIVQFPKFNPVPSSLPGVCSIRGAVPNATFQSLLFYVSSGAWRVPNYNCYFPISSHDKTSTSPSNVKSTSLSLKILKSGMKRSQALLLMAQLIW
ncbi:hypothetical protein EJB05_42659, partial [Eragrostis curvula]